MGHRDGFYFFLRTPDKNPCQKLVTGKKRCEAIKTKLKRKSASEAFCDFASMKRVEERSQQDDAL